MKIIKLQYQIKAPLTEVWKSLVDKQYINNWGGGPVEMEDKVGFNFTLWDGEIWGTNIKIIKHELLKQEWFSDEANKWDQPSIVTFKLTYKDGITTLDLLHEQVPDRNAKDIEDGWKEYYLGPLKEYLELKA
jgi:activator of HSP90 ATPase